MSSVQSLNRSIKSLKKRRVAEDEFKKTKLLKRKFLREQIIKHDRIDLLMTQVLGYECKDFHYLMYQHRKHCYAVVGDRKEKSFQKWHLALAPRGGGKTTVLTISSIILDIIKNRDIRILIASKTDSNGVAFLAEIKKKMKSKKFIELFGDLEGPVWNDGEVIVNGRSDNAPKGFTISTVGVGSALASRHFDKIYADDLVDDTNSITDVQRDKIKTWFFKILDPTLVPNGEMSIIGTRYHHEDLYGILIDDIFTKKNKKGKILKSYYIRIPALMKKKGVSKKAKAKDKWISYWPERFSVSFLLSKKRKQGTIIFNSQYQNDTEAMKGKIFRFDWFKWVKPEELPKMEDMYIFGGCDLAIKQSEKNDKFALTTIGVCKKTRNIYILDYYNRVTHYRKQKETLGNRFDRYDHIRIGVESNGYQLALVEDMRVDEKLQRVRCRPVYTDTDKTVRAWKLSAYFERGQVYLIEGMHEMQEHLLKLPDGRYKDLFDSLDIAVTTAFGGKRKKRENEPGVM